MKVGPGRPGDGKVSIVVGTAGQHDGTLRMDWPVELLRGLHGNLPFVMFNARIGCHPDNLMQQARRSVVGQVHFDPALTADIHHSFPKHDSERQIRSPEAARAVSIFLPRLGSDSIGDASTLFCSFRFRRFICPNPVVIHFEKIVWRQRRE
eukprot:SAG22_NODE_87_length_21437_cov_14.162480_12_plen_151_part_00